jgi:hypothetical protein
VLNVTVHPNPVPTITGDNASCVGYSNVVYSTEAGMASYTWALSSGGTITSGQGTHQVHVTWNSPGTHTLSVIFTTVNGCSVGTPTQYNVIVYSVDQPTISGANIACANSGLYLVYSTETGMSDYQWTISAGGALISGQGTSQVEVNWTSGGNKSVSVNYTNPNGCSALNPTVFTVTVNAVPAAAGPVNGAAAVCTGATGVAYSCAPVSGATSYIWTLPAGVVITNGAGTNSILADFTSSASSGNISVFASNLCGDGAASPPLNVSVNPLPSTPLATAEDALLTSTAPEGNQWYFEGMIIPGANGQVYEATQTGWYWTEVTLNGCISDTSNHVYVLITGMNELPGVSLLIYPQPNDGRFHIMLRGNDLLPLRLIILNTLGETVYERDGIRVDGELVIPVELLHPTSGIYLLIIENPSARLTRKLVVR